MTDTRDKNGRHLRRGDHVHFEIHGQPYSGVVNHLIWRDHEAAIMTVIQLYLPATAVSKDQPEAKKGRADLNEEKQHSNQQEPKSAEANRGTTKAEPTKKGSH